MKNRSCHLGVVVRAVALLASLGVASCTQEQRATSPVSSMTAGGWEMIEAGKVSVGGEVLSTASYRPGKWYRATVPGTVLTTLVDNGVYPEPMYGENNRKIPETLCRQDYWYRAAMAVPTPYAGRKVWLNFDGINYAAEIWVNGKNIGAMRGAFTRARFDVSSLAKAGEQLAIAVKVSPQPTPGVPHEHTIKAGMGKNGGVTAIDGPTFLSTIGWDWIPAIRDRDTGIWQKVFLSSSGDVLIESPLVTTDLPLPRTDTAEVSVSATLRNVSDKVVRGNVRGSFEGVTFERGVELAAGASVVVKFSPSDTPQLRVGKPRLWWPNGLGSPELYKLHLAFDEGGAVSDARDVQFGIRKVGYTQAGSENLALSVNGVPVFARGGNWGLDEAMKRIPRERLEAQIRMHRDANLNIIRNWVGQSTSEDFYDLCDKYGIMLWDEFFQPNPSDGPNPTDLPTYFANVRDKILRFRNHPSIVVWCARNEGHPPREIEEGLVAMMRELEPTRLYQSSSTDGRGVHSGGPYFWRKPEAYYEFNEPFKTEIGSMSVPTLESVKGMLEKKDWETINDAWAEHDMARGAQGGDRYPRELAERYGKIANLADFVRKSQLANYEAHRALYEGRLARMFKPANAAILWMSSPAQPSFVWQLYHHDLEPNASLFGAQKANEPVHVQMNQKEGTLEMVNNLPAAFSGEAWVRVLNLDGTLASEKRVMVEAGATSEVELGAIEWPAGVSPVHFVKLELRDAGGKVVSDNFYWHKAGEKVGDYSDLAAMPKAEIEVTKEAGGSSAEGTQRITLRNPTSHVALMVHVQLRDRAGKRILPVFYSENYVSLLPGETRKVWVTAPKIVGDAVVAVDGWNVSLAKGSVGAVLNEEALPERWPVTGLPIDMGPRAKAVRANFGRSGVAGFGLGDAMEGGADTEFAGRIDVSAPGAAPEAVYRGERWGNVMRFDARMEKGAGRKFVVRLHYAETRFEAAGKRAFNVAINGKQVERDFDIFKEAGGKDRAVVREYRGVEPDAEGDVVVRFTKGAADSPKVCAIEVLPEQ